MEKSNLKTKELEKKEEITKEKPKEESTKSTKKNNKKTILIASVIILIMAVVLALSVIFAIMNINNNNIVSGVKIEGIDVSGLSREDAKNKIENIYQSKKGKDITLKYNDFETTLSPELLEVNYDIDKGIEEAVAIGKSDNIFINNFNIIKAMLGKNIIKINMTINEEVAKQNIEDISVNIPGAVTEPSYYIENDKLIITKGKEGIKVDNDKLIEKIKKQLQDINSTQEYIEIPVTEKTPEEINIDKIHEEVYKEVQDAYYTKDPFTIHPEVEGVDFNIEEAKEQLKEDKEQYEIQLTITKPKVTTAQIGSEAFPDLLATYSTRYDGGDRDRTTNLRIACQKINEKVVLPGETFSYNQTLGVRSTATGYKNAKVYENGQVVDGIGGGICQISSTLYNSVLMANLDIVERKNHQFVTSYTPAGRDATVVYGMTDFKFKNSRKYAIKIKASAANGVATVSIYGIKEENEYTVSFSTKTISTIPFSVQYVDDSTLAAGTEKVKQKGANGIITETYITKSLNGKVVSTKLLSRDTYNAMQRIILRGTKGATTSNNVDNNQAVAPTPSAPATDNSNNQQPTVDNNNSQQQQPDNSTENAGSTETTDNTNA